MTTAFITHRDCWKHDMGAHHPECPERLGAIQDRLIASGLDLYLSFHDAPVAEMEQLLRVHPRSYIETLESSNPQHGIFHLDPDTAMSPGTWQAALRSAGAGVLAVDLVMKKEAPNAFCAVRPPGHHAERAKAMGFCFFNNISVAARHAVEAWGLKRVAVVDFDVHHGNGTEEILAGDEHVLMVGTFQHPFYPYCGTENPASNMLNVPLKAGTRGDVFREVVEKTWLPRLREFAPEMIFISAGFDAHYEDDMGSMGLLESDYAWGLKRVAVVDFDVHHGNGTEEILAGDEHVLMVGTFQHPFYPYCGTENPASNMLNVPLKAGTRGDVFREVVEKTWLPRLREFAPEMIFISAGFDAHYEDDMGSMGLLESDYAWVTERLMEVARETAQGRIVSMLEGGYSLSALARSVAAHIKVLAEL